MLTKKVEFDQVWLELMLGRYQEVVSVKRQSADSRTYWIWIQLVKKSKTKSGKKILAVRYGNSTAVHCELLPLTALYQTVCPPTLNRGQQLIWSILRRQFRRELDLIASSFMTICGVHYPPLRPSHLLPRKVPERFFSLATPAGTLSFLRQVEFGAVTLVLVSATLGHPFRQSLEEGVNIKIRIADGTFAPYLKSSREERLVLALRSALIPTGRPQQLS